MTGVQKWSYTNHVDFSSTFYIMQQCFFLCSIYIGFNYSWSSLKLIKTHTHTHTKKHTLFSNQRYVSPLSLCIYMDELQAVTSRPRVGQPGIPWGVPVPLFPAIHSSITSKAPSAGGFYTNTCSLIYNSQWACRHPRLGITHVDNSSGAYILGSKGHCLNLEV